MELSVVIATWNRRRLLQRTIESLLLQTLAPERYEIVVVVDGSTDGTAEFLCDFRPGRNLIVVVQPNRGQAAARNAGIAVAKGTILLLLDDDIVADRNLLAAHLNAHRDRQDRVVFGPTLVHDDSRCSVETDALRGYVYWRMQCLQDALPEFPRDAMFSSNSSAPTSLLKAVGAFDEGFVRSIEDIELGYRLWLHAVEFIYQPDAITHHVYDKTAKTLVGRDAAQFGCNEVLLCRKYAVHRPHSMLTKLATGPLWKLAAARCATALPVSPDPLLLPVYAGLVLLRRFSLARTIAVRVLRIREGIAVIRSAVHFIGSWEKYINEFAAPSQYIIN